MSGNKAMLKKIALAVVITGLLAALSACAGTASHRLSPAARASASQDAQSLKTTAGRIAVRCGNAMAGPGARASTPVAALAQPQALRELATRRGQDAFAACLFPDPAKRSAGIACVEQAFMGGISGLATFSPARRHRAEGQLGQQVFGCVQGHL